jgi:hypothetical protein
VMCVAFSVDRIKVFNFLAKQPISGEISLLSMTDRNNSILLSITNF